MLKLTLHKLSLYIKYFKKSKLKFCYMHLRVYHLCKFRIISQKEAGYWHNSKIDIVGLSQSTKKYLNKYFIICFQQYPKISFHQNMEVIISPIVI